MTSIKALRKLIADLEAATEGGRELDALIWAEFDNRDVRQNKNKLILAKSRDAPHDECLLGTIDPGKLSSNFQIAGHMPPISHYTTSLDAALTLVPYGWHVSHAYWNQERATFNMMRELEVYAGGEASTPAIALCIAALKARLVEMETNDLETRHG